MNETLNKKESLYQFDVLRAIAIIGVFLVHCQYAIYPDFDLTYQHIMADIPSAGQYQKFLSLFPFAYGGIGVLLFFLISGYLIHYTTLKNGPSNFNLRLYFSKRFWRIYPPYFFALLFFCFSKRSFMEILHSPFDLLSHIFLVNNYNNEYIFSINGVFWSLAAEAQLYLLYPSLLFLRFKTNINTVIILQFILGIVTTALWWYFFDFKDAVIGNSIFRLWFVWGLGAYIAEAYYFKRKIFDKFPNWLLFALFVLVYFSKIFYFHYAFGIYAYAFLLAIALEKYLYKKSQVNNFEKILIPIGLCSYSIYLFHMPFLNALFYGIDIFKISHSSKFLFLLINCIPVFLVIYFFSLSSFKLIEMKSIELGNFLYKKNHKNE